MDVYRHPRDSCTMIGPTPWTHGLDVPWWLQVFCALVKVWFVVTEHSAPCDLGWLAKMGGILWLNLILSLGVEAVALQTPLVEQFERV